MIDLDPDRNPLEMLAEEFAERCRQGECPSVSEYAERFPELADAIRDLFPSIGMIESLGRSEHDTRAHLQQRHKFRGRVLDPIGEYAILRELGRGGMGVVFEARQASLGRRVALKVLPSGALSTARQLRRFRREATAAARLHHTNIVPVFGIGEHEDLHYYAMQFIDGVALDRVLYELRRIDSGEADTTAATANEAVTAARCVYEGRLATAEATAIEPAVSRKPQPRAAAYWKAVAQIGAQVAAALDYAHSRGVLHRDIKPANLLLDRQGTVWVADFGLAQLEEHDDLASRGDVVGTLRYMAPEQFAGNADARSDIFSLGMTLYELLTLKPARESTATSHPLHQFETTELPHPRSIDRTIPRDLETIVLKAAAVDPARRYCTAGELAEDLQRYLSDRPILARRISAAERLWRWGRRNPLSATLTGAVLALLIVVAVVTSVSNVRTTIALRNVDEALRKAEHSRQHAETARVQAELAQRQAEDQRQQAQDEHARAEANLALALDAFQDISDSVAARGVPERAPPEVDNEENDDDLPASEVAVTAADAELLEGMVKFFDDFAQRNDADLRVETAQAHRRVGDIRQRLGQFDEAETAYRTAIVDYQAMLAKHPDDPQHVIAQAAILNELGVVLFKRGRAADAHSAHQSARELLEAQSPEFLETAEARFALAETLAHLAGGVPGGRNFGGGARGNLREHQEYIAEAIELLRGLVDEEPTNTDYLLTLARASRSSVSSGVREDRAASAAALQEAIEILEALVAAHPRDSRFRFELADSLAMTTRARSDEDMAERRARLERSVSLGQELHDSYPGVPEYRNLVANSLVKLAGVQRHDERPVEADGNYRQAVALQTALVEQYPQTPGYRLALARSQTMWADLQRERGQLAESQQTLKTGIAAIDAWGAKTEPEPAFAFHHIEAGLYQSLSRTLRQAGETQAANEAAQQAKKLDPRPWSRGPARRRPRPASEAAEPQPVESEPQ